MASVKFSAGTSIGPGSVGYNVNASDSSVDCSYCHKSFRNHLFFESNNHANINAIKSSLAQHWRTCSEWKRLNRPSSVPESERMRQTRKATQSLIEKPSSSASSIENHIDENCETDDFCDNYNGCDDDHHDADDDDHKIEDQTIVCDSSIDQILLGISNTSTNESTSRRVFEIQKIISDIFFSEVQPFFTRRHIANDCDALDWHDYTSIADWGSDVSLTESQGSIIFI
jgi:hypothetical protein